MELIITTSLIIAFLAGMAALFAPCCITVLLPAYFASIFRQKTKVFFMTFVFFLGILLVFLPLGLGFGGLGKLFIQMHDWIYGIGAVILLGLGLSILTGFHVRMPFHVTPRLENKNVGSIFLLGIFSGLATTCCAPVLAGVLALSVLPGSVFFGAIYAITYVLGMVVPLFFLAFFVDKTSLVEKFSFFKKSISYQIFGKEILITISNLISGLMFVFMGVLILNIAGKLKMESYLQMTVNIYTAKLVNSISDFLTNIPSFVLPVFFIAVLLVIAKFAISQSKN